MALDMRIALSGELFDSGVQRVNHADMLQQNALVEASVSLPDLM